MNARVAENETASGEFGVGIVTAKRPQVVVNDRPIAPETYKVILDLMPVVCVDLLVRRGAQYLLVKRRDEPLKGEWWVPGGRILKGEMALEACYRKLKNETGLVSDGFSFVGYYEDFYETSAFEVPCHSVSLVYETHISVANDVRLDPTCEDFKWDWGLPSRLRFRLK